MALILPKKRAMEAVSKGKVRDTEHSGVILTKQKPLDESRKQKVRGRRQTLKRKGNELSLEMFSNHDWAYMIRADLWVEHIMDSLLRHHRANILQGMKADGSGPQPPLDEDTRQHGGGTRGNDTGFFADSLRRSKITGSTRTASARITADPKREAFLAKEASFGVEYLFVTGDAETVISKAAAQVLDLSVEGQIKRRADAGQTTARQET